MATRNIIGTIQVRRDSATNWATRNPILKAGEFGYDTTNATVKIGDGSTPWQDLVGLMRNYVIYGVKIDRANSNPLTSVTYTDDATGFTAALECDAGSWANKFPFNRLRPCILKNGTIVGYLNPDDYAQYENGESAPISDRSAGDVMVEFPKCYYRIEQDDNYTYVKISDSPVSMLDGFTDWAFSYNGIVRDKFYIGAYKGNIYNDKLYSTNDQSITASKTIGVFREAAHARGAGYEITPYNKLILMQILYLIRFKSLNSQAALGGGIMAGTGAIKTGVNNQNLRGLYYGDTILTQVHIRCHGIEDLWGNINEFIDGLIAKEHRCRIADGNFNDVGSGYNEAYFDLDAPYMDGYIKSVCGNSKFGFLISEKHGSTSTYYCDKAGWSSSSTGVCTTIAGGYWASGRDAGMFAIEVDKSPSYSNVDTTARLCFCGNAVDELE